MCTCHWRSCSHLLAFSHDVAAQNLKLQPCGCMLRLLPQHQAMAAFLNFWSVLLFFLHHYNNLFFHFFPGSPLSRSYGLPFLSAWIWTERNHVFFGLRNLTWAFTCPIVALVPYSHAFPRHLMFLSCILLY